MKQIFSLLLLLHLCASCAKIKDFHYAVNCDFPSTFGNQAWIVVSNDEGDILQDFVVPPRQTQLTEQFDFQVKSAEDSYNLHLIQIIGTFIGDQIDIKSHYGVRNGATVVFQPEQVYYTPPDEGDVWSSLFIADVPALDSLDIPGIYMYSSIIYSHYDSVSRVLKIQCNHPVWQDLVVRIRSTPSAPFHSLYLPMAATTHVDSVFINWTDLTRESNLQPIELPGDNAPFCSVYALDTDFRRFVSLAYNESESTPQFNFPAGVNTHSPLRISMSRGDQNDYYVQDIIFQPGEALKMEDAGMRITNATLSQQGVLEIQTEGEVGLLRAVFSQLATPVGSEAHWRVEGEPIALRQAILPDLSYLLPDWISLSHFNARMEVTAYHYDHLTHTQLLEGLPYKGNNGKLFPEARYGMRKIFKTF